MAYFVCRLLPPRANFIADMTDEEMALMGQHSAYLSGLAERGAALMFGPVLDPKGAWGLAILNVADQAEAEAIGAADPVIKSGAGFAYEILPMMSAVIGRLPPTQGEEASARA